MILLHIAVPFSQQQLLKRLSFSPLYSLASFVEGKMPIGVWVYLWAFYLVPLSCISVFVPVPYCLDDCSFLILSEVRKVDSSSSILQVMVLLHLHNKATLSGGLLFPIYPVSSALPRSLWE